MKFKVLIHFVITLLITSCATFNPNKNILNNVLKREQKQSKNNIEVSSAIPSAKETIKIFSRNLYKKDIQPVWLDITNNNSKPIWFLPYSIDPNYFTPLEAAYINHFFLANNINKRIDKYFYEVGFDGMRIAPNSKKSGFLFTHIDQGSKEFNIDLMEENGKVETMTFFINVPGLRVDHDHKTLAKLYSPKQIISYSERIELEKYLEKLPCCTTNKKGTKNGDPLNLVIIGNSNEIHRALIRAKWNETEIMHTKSIWSMLISYVFRKSYKHAPISPLFVFSRHQDISFQKARNTINERNHLRLWKTPVQFKKKPVWIGQTSRDIGFVLSTHSLITHQIDPDVDEARDYLLQNLWYSLALSKFTYVKGVGFHSINGPSYNLSNHTYFTDGRRLVLWPSSYPAQLDDVSFFEWKK